MIEIYIDSSPYLNRIAILKNNKLREFYIDKKNDIPKKDEIYKGVVKELSRGLKCAFLDIGNLKKAYLYLQDTNMNIKKGDEILVQVQKVEKDGKKAKVTTNIILTGEKILLNNSSVSSISKNYSDRKLGQKVLSKLKKPDKIGVVLRTHSSLFSLEEIQEEIDILYEDYTNLNKKLIYNKKPALLYDNNGILGKVIRDNINSGLYKIIVDDEDMKLKAQQVLDKYKHNAVDIEVYDNKEIHLFKYYGFEKILSNLCKNTVTLDCGGEIVINKTEAMYVIDVNSKKNIKERDLINTIHKTNLEAAEEIAKQICLRNLNGIILVDFIDDGDNDRRLEIMNRVDTNLKDGKGKYTIFPFTDLNIMQITRKDAGFGINEFLGLRCPCCNMVQYNILNEKYLMHQIYVELKKIEGKLKIMVQRVYEKSKIEEEILKLRDDLEVLFFDEDGFKVEKTI